MVQIYSANFSYNLQKVGIWAIMQFDKIIVRLKFVDSFRAKLLPFAD